MAFEASQESFNACVSDPGRMMFRSRGRAPRNRWVLSFLGWVLPMMLFQSLCFQRMAAWLRITTLLSYPDHYDNIRIWVTTLTRREILCRIKSYIARPLGAKKPNFEMLELPASSTPSQWNSWTNSHSIYHCSHWAWLSLPSYSAFGFLR